MFPFPYLLDIYSGFYLNLHINRAFFLDNIAVLTWMAARAFLRLKNFFAFFYFGCIPACNFLSVGVSVCKYSRKD